MTSRELFGGHVVIITGAASGIGRCAAQRFAAAGAAVVVADINARGAQAVADALPRAMAVAVDVADHDSVVAMVDTAVEAHGKIDIVINGAMRTGRSTFLKATVAEFRDEFEVNLLGSFLVCQSAIPVMIAGGGGVIINISSVNGITHLGNEAYSAAKAGLIALTRGVACEFGEHGIRCCGVAPGTVRTEVWAHREANDPGVLDRAASWYPLGRIGDPEDIAAALMFLASDQASWISGVTLPVDGGLLAGNLAMSRAITAGDSD